jgi:F-type H+-transporting ATPase subunit epsilon
METEHGEHTIHVYVVSAEEEIFDGEASFVALPGEAGELGIYPQHAPLITRIRPGTVRIRMPGRAEDELVFVAGGILEVQPDEVTVLAETAIRGRDLDEARAQKAKQQAEESLSNQHSKFDYARAQAELATAVAQLRAIAKLRERR